MSTLENPHNLELPDNVKAFARWLEDYVNENGGLPRGKFTVAHLREMQEAALTFGLVMEDDGLLHELRVMQ
jgi:hypothetical protein